MRWKVLETRLVAKQLQRLPKKVGLIYRELVDDLEREGPMPFGWDSKPLQGREEFRIRLTREYRVLLTVMKPNLIIVKVAHRKEIYE